MENKQIIVDINIELTDEILEDIFDCWVAFVTGDLGFQVNDLPMLVQ